MAIPTADSYPGTPGSTIRGGLPALSAGGLITALSLVNTSGSTQEANFVSPMLGMPFKQGDVPSGQYPQFQLTDNTPCPATIWGVTTWPDGSMKFCGAMIRVPTTIAGSGTLTINVKNGGSAPAASSRGTSDFTAADLKTELTGVTSLSGVWTASLNTAITDATEISVVGDGPAGKVYRIRGALKQSGAAHGQLDCWHYAAALQNNAGGLLGLRYLGRIAQPWVDVTSPAADRRVVTGVLKSGAATLRTLQGADYLDPGTPSLGSTPVTNITIGHYTSFFTAGSNAQWDYVQGGGSASADCTVRVQHDKTYFVKTRLVPPYDLSSVATGGTSVNYYPYCNAGMNFQVGDTGERADIGVLTAWAVRHIHTQAAADQQRVRAVGLASGGWQQVYRRGGTGQILAVHDAAASYTGLGTIQTTWRIRGENNIAGVVTPANYRNLWISEYETSHRPSATYYPYLITGEPQYLDMLVEQANGPTIGSIQGYQNKRVTGTITRTNTNLDGNFGERDVIIGSTTYKAGGLFFCDGLTRGLAWWYRDLAQAGGIYPDTCPYGGTQTRKYFRDQVSQAALAMNDYNSRFGTGWSTFGYIGFDQRPLEAKPWNHGYLSNALCHVSSVLPSSETATLRQFVGQFWQNAASQMDIAGSYAYEGNLYDENDLRATQFSGFMFGFGGELVFSTGTNRATIKLYEPFPTLVNVTPTNGDVFAFNPGTTKPYSGVLDLQKLYAVNCSGNTFQLALTPGGAAITVNTGVTINAWLCRMASLAPVLTAEGIRSNTSYMANINSAIRHHAALGDSVSTAVTNSGARITSAGGAIDFVADPKNFLAAAYPA